MSIEDEDPGKAELAYRCPYREKLCFSYSKVVAYISDIPTGDEDLKWLN